MLGIRILSIAIPLARRQRIMSSTIFTPVSLGKVHLTIMSSLRESSTGYSTPTFLNPRSPPPPPPKSRPTTNPSQPSHQQHQLSGPPLPPPPPTLTHPTLSQSSTPHQPQQSSHPQPPSPSETWLPQILLDKPYLPPSLSSPKTLTNP